MVKRSRSQVEKTEVPKPDAFRKQSITELDSETWQEGAFESKISIARSTGGNEGIKIRTAKKTWRFNEHRYGIWLPKGLNIAAWLKWIIVTIKRYSKKFWKSAIDVDALAEEVDVYRQRAADLEIELERTKARLSQSEEHLRIEQDNRRRAEQLASKIDEYEQAIADFVQLLDDTSLGEEHRESEVKKKIRENRWFLGLECEIGASEQSIDVQAAIDLHIRTDFNQDKVFEFKSPNIEPFYRKGKQSRLFLKVDLGDAIHQLILYLRKTNLYSYLKEEGTYGLRGPSGLVIMGYKLDGEQENAINDWNFHLRPHIQLLTYDALVDNARRQLRNIRSARNSKSVE